MNTTYSKFRKAPYLEIISNAVVTGVAVGLIYISHDEFLKSFNSSDINHILSNTKQMESAIYSIASGIGALVFASKPAMNLVRTSIIYCNRLVIRTNPESYPLESVDEVVIKDTKGLEQILQKTQEKLPAEWGTVLRVYAQNTKAIITEIMNPRLAEEKGVVTNHKKDKVKIDLNKVLGYNGTQHYHPDNARVISIPISNYRINNYDRATSKIDSIHLITFNTSQGPEIIAHNQRYTYIPKSMNDKNILIKANRRKIQEYLKKQSIMKQDRYI